MIPLLRTALRFMCDARLRPAVYALLFTFYALPALAQNKAPAPGGAPLPPEKEAPAVDQARVDAAVARGAEWLRALLKKGLPLPPEAGEGIHSGQTYNEMVLYTLVHAGVDRGDPDLIKLVHAIRSQPPVHTYTGAMRAMAFEMYDPVKLRQELAMTAQFLVDNQGQNGQWGYSRPIPWPAPPSVTFTPSAKPPDYTLSGPGSGQGPSAGSGQGPAAGAPPAGGGNAGAALPGGGAPGAAGTGPSIVKSSTTLAKKTMPKYTLPRRDWGSPNDNSNTQYAVLGLRACMAAGIMPPPDCLPITEKRFTEFQNDDGGWGYGSENRKDASTGSMTVGGVSSLAVCVRGTKNAEPRKDPRIQKGLQWLGQNIVWNRNPQGFAGYWHFYWIYGAERAGALAETEWFGDHPWYYEGANWLLDCQNADGTWGKGSIDRESRKSNSITDTCWAILFLRRATRHIAQKKIEYTR